MKNRKILILIFLGICLLCFPVVGVYATDVQLEKPIFSAEELKYIREKETIKIAVISDWKPFSYITEYGEYEGPPNMILHRFAEASGIRLEFIPVESYSQSLDKLNKGEVDVVGLLTEYSTEEKYSAEGTNVKIIPYVSSQAVMIQHKNTNLSELPVVIFAEVKGKDKFTQNQNISEIYYKNPQECLNAVRAGQADAAVCDSFTGAAMMEAYWAEDLLSVPSTIMQEFGFGIRSDSDSRLASSLQKTIDSFPKEDISICLIKGSDYQISSFLKFVYRYPFEIICFCIAIMFILTISLLTYTKVKLRQHQSLQGYEESYRLLSDTFGEAGMEYDYLNDSMKIFGKNSKLDIEEKTDDFKECLKNKAIRISLTAEALEQIISDGVENNSFATEFQCGVKSGEWVWYRLIYTVICTTESHKRPIRLVGCLANIDEEHAERERLMKLSSNDQLTGLLNHATAEKKICDFLNDNEESREDMLVVLDIDNFKQFNDLKGHLCGDDVLRSIGRVIYEIFSEEDILCRWGGDEFLLYLVNKGLINDEFASQIELLRKKMKDYQYKGEAYPVTLSIGGAKNYPCSNFDILFQQADDALYLAKKNGKDQFWLYAPTVQTTTELEEESDAK